MKPNRLAGWPVVLDLAYLFALGLCFPYLVYKLLATDKYRAHLADRLGLRVTPRADSRPCLWVHGVSVGEVMTSRSLVHEFQQARPDWSIAISTTTRTGRQVANRYLSDHHRFYFPFDLSWSNRRIFDSVRPDAIVLMELEIWPGFLAEAARRRVPVYLFNGRISGNSFRGYHRGRAISRLFLGAIDRFSVQTDLYRDRLVALGVPEKDVEVTGNMKYDNLPKATDPQRARTTLEKLGIGPEETILLAASTHDPEEEKVARAVSLLQEQGHSVRLVVVPRHPERGEKVARTLESSGIPAVLWSQQRPAPPESALVVDEIGILLDLLPAAQFVFVGGSWIDHGGQNVLEPAACGRPIFIGPSTHNFEKEVAHLTTAGALSIVRTPEELASLLTPLLEEPRLAIEIGNRARRAVDGLQGATRRNLAKILQPDLDRAVSQRATT